MAISSKVRWILFGVAAVLILWVGAAVALWEAWDLGSPAEPAPPPSGAARVERAIVEGIERYSELDDTATMEPGPETDALATRWLLRGTARLADADLVRLAELRLVLMAQDDLVCAAQWETRDANAATMRALQTFDDDQLADWADLRAKAMALERRGGPRPMDREVARSARDELDDRVLPTAPDDRERYSRLRNESPLSDEDACFMARAIHEGALALPPAEAATYLRALSELSAPE